MRDPILELEQRLGEAERELGSLPADVAIADYTPESFARLRPQDSYDVWRGETAAVILYLRSRGIKVLRRQVSAFTQQARAAQAGMGPYRLGISIGRSGTKYESYSAIGFAVVTRDASGQPIEGNPTYEDES